MATRAVCRPGNPGEPGHYHQPGSVLRRLARVSTIPAALALAACAAPRPLLSPLAPQTLGSSMTARQQVIVQRDGAVRRLQVALKVAPAKLTLIGLTALGQRLFTLSWNGGHAKLQSTVDSTLDIDPIRILADLQLAYWPLAVLRAALPDRLHLDQYGTARVLWRDAKLLWFASSETADRWGSTMTLYNVSAGYRVTIRPLALDDAQ